MDFNIKNNKLIFSKLINDMKLYVNNILPEFKNILYLHH